MAAPLSQEEKIKRGAEDSGGYFRRMAEFVGFTQEDAKIIHASGLIIEKYLPEIVSQFYDHLLRYPPTRAHFLQRDGTLDRDYIQLRMHHLTNFWRRTALGKYDDEYARYIDYVGRAHTSHGADPSIYIAERYVIGQVGFMQHAISQALTKELHAIDPELEIRSLRAWNLLMMVILEVLARAYSDEHETEIQGPAVQINPEAVFDLAVETYELGLGMRRPVGSKQVLVGEVDAIGEGERKIIQVDDLSIGVFHHHGGWYALRNSCLHRGGPVCTGTLDEDVLTCPWHGYQYNVTNGELLVDTSAKLATYPVEVRAGLVYIQVPIMLRETANLDIIQGPKPAQELQLSERALSERALKENEFDPQEIAPGQSRVVFVGSEPVVVYNAEGKFYALHNRCTHAGGPLHEGSLNGVQVTCPWHGSCFDITNGKVLSGPATEALRTYGVVIADGIGRVE